MKSFRGGIVLPTTRSAKAAAADSEPVHLSPPLVAISLRVRKTVLTPCVAVGQAVCVGDRLAQDPTGFIPPFHSGVSGTVTAVGAFYPAADGGEAPTVIVENDHKQVAGSLLSPLSLDEPPDTIVQRMYDAGLVGLGGGGFPTHRKYRDARARHLLINGCECEPYLAADEGIARRFAGLIAQGVRFLAKAGGVAEEHVRLCVESPAAATVLQGAGLPVITLSRRYPQGSERQLIESVLGERLPEGALPSQAGILVSNIATAAAMGDAARGLPLTHRVVTVSGAVQTPVNVLAPIGTPFSELAALATPTFPARARYIAGGPMTGRRLTSLKAGLPKACGGLTVLQAQSAPETPCIRCGACARVCPARLMPFLIDAASLVGERERCRELRAAACLSCGCCSYVCPAKRQLAARITAVKRDGGQRR